MSRRCKYVLLLGLAVLVMLVAVPFLITEPEPAYDGKKLSEWVEVYGDVTQNGIARSRASEAIRQIGPNAAPYLLRWVRWNDGPVLKLTLFPAIDRVFRSRLMNRENARARGAESALLSFPMREDIVVPALTSLVNQRNNPPQARRALRMLEGLSGRCLSVNLALMTNRSPWVRLETIDRLDLGQTNWSPLIVLFQGLADPDTAVAEKSAYYLGAFGGQADIIVPKLAKHVADKRAGVRDDTIHSLVRFGTRAGPAVPALLDLLKTADHQTRKLVISALMTIDPEALEKATQTNQ